MTVYLLQGVPGGIGRPWEKTKSGFCHSQTDPLVIYSQASLIRASLIRMPQNPNTVPGILLSFSIYNDSVIGMFHNPNLFVKTRPDCTSED